MCRCLLLHSERSVRILTELLRAFESKANFKASVKEMHLVLRSNGVDTFTVEEIDKSCRKIAKEKKHLEDTSRKLHVLSEAIKLVLGPLNRECANVVSYKSVAMERLCDT